MWTATSPAGPFTLQTRNAQTNGGEDWDRFFRLNYDDVDEEEGPTGGLGPDARGEVETDDDFPRKGHTGSSAELTTLRSRSRAQMR